MNKKIIPFLLAGYIFLENKLMLCTRREYFGDGIKIAHISDIHKRRFGKNNSRICRIISHENPDIIFITGDLVSRTETDFSAVEKMLENLCKIAPVYMICGNHERTLKPDMKKEFFRIIKRTGVVMLANNSADINIRGRSLHICGLMENYKVYKNGKSYRNLYEIIPEDINALLGKCPDGETILLAHSPFFAEVYSQWGAEYTLSGHVHGGVIRIFGKGILSPERKFFPPYSKGVYDVGGMRLLVSGGLGKFRLFNPPEIVIYNI
ncbi:MAG: metallophosphoesterase [Ruminococcus flavefaciens]|nr:metallophosphoesterase [Ruminococcus flavefaciens]